MIAAVGGHAALLQQAKEIEDDPVLGNSENIWFDWRDMKGDIQTIHFQIAAIPLLCKRVGRQRCQLKLFQTFPAPKIMSF